MVEHGRHVYPGVCRRNRRGEQGGVIQDTVAPAHGLRPFEGAGAHEAVAGGGAGGGGGGQAGGYVAVGSDAGDVTGQSYLNADERLGATVKISANRKGSGSLTIRFGSLDQLDGLLARVQ